MALPLQWQHPTRIERTAGDLAEPAAVARAKADREAFDPIYRANLGLVFGYCFRRLGDAHAAEDATQQVFTQALAKLHTCRDESFRSWLLAIAHNVTANVVRSRRPLVPLEAAAEQPDFSVSPEDQAINSDLMTQMRNHIAQLTEDQRSVLELRFSGASVEETARVLETSAGAVKQLHRRGMVRLRQLMGLNPNGEDGSDA